MVQPPKEHPVQSEDDYRHCLKTLSKGSLAIRQSIFDVVEGGGYLHDYSSLKEFYQKWVNKHYELSYIYKLINAATIEKHLGVKIGSIRESVLRPLSSQKNDPDWLRGIWKVATKIRERPTAKTVKEAIQRYQEQHALTEIPSKPKSVCKKFLTLSAEDRELAFTALAEILGKKLTKAAESPADSKPPAT